MKTDILTRFSGNFQSSYKSLIALVALTNPSLNQRSSVSLEGGFANLVSLKTYAELAKDAKALIDHKFDRNSFLLGAPKQSVCTEAISACTAMGISNGDRALICHFNALVLTEEPQRSEVLVNIKVAVDLLRKTAKGPLKSIIYSGEKTNGLELEGLMKSGGVNTLALIDQKRDPNGDGYEGGFVYSPENDQWNVHTYQVYKDGRSIPATLGKNITTVNDLGNCFERITLSAKNTWKLFAMLKFPVNT